MAALSKGEAAARFMQRYGSDTRVDWSKQTGLPTLVYNFSAPKAAADDVEAAKQFIADSVEFFLKGEDVANLHAQPKREGGGAVHIDFQQYYRDVPVLDAILSVHIAGDNIIMVNGVYIPDIQLDTTPILSADDAMNAVKRDLGQGPLLSRDNPHPELVINTNGVKPLLTWRVDIQSLTPLADWEYLIDATSGAVVTKTDRSRKAVGSGVVFPDNPVVTPNPVVAILGDLDGTGVLRGDCADVSSFQGFDPSGKVIQAHEALSSTLSFGSLPDRRAFSEQMVFYHMDRAHDYFRLLGFNSPDLIRFPATVHYRQSDKVPYDDSAFIPSCKCLYFGDGSGKLGTGYYNSAFDAEIIFHEYTHGVIFSKVPQLDGNGESYGTAMDEGFADYFAASSFNTPIIGQWRTIPSPQQLRRLDNSNRFPENINDPLSGRREGHYTGLIWSGGLWDIRASLGSLITDRLALGSLDFLKRTGATFQDGLVALITADVALRGGVDVPLIRLKMNLRGIFEPQVSYIGDSDFSALHNNTPQMGSIPTPPAGLCQLGQNQFSIYVPPGTSSLTLDASGNGNINMYVRFGGPVFIENNTVISNYRSESSGNSEHVAVSLSSLPALATGTYYVAFTNCSPTPVTYTVTALISSNGASRTDEVGLASGVPVTNAIAGNFSPNHTVGVLGDVQYFIDVPANARLLNVKLIGVTPGTDVDLLLRAGKRVEIDKDGFPVVDKVSPTATNVESLELDSSTTPRLVPSTRYFIAVANFSAFPAGFQVTATVSTTATPPSEVPLTSGVARSDTLGGLVGSSTLSATNYVIAVPNGASQLRVELVNNSGTPADLFIRQGSRVFVNGGGVVGDFASSQNGPVQVITLDRSAPPALDNDVYYIAVLNRAPNAINFTLLATVMQGGGTQTNTQVFHGSVVTSVIDAPQAGSVVIDGDQFFVDVPATVTSLTVRLEGPETNNLVLLERVGQRIIPTDGDIDNILDKDKAFTSAEFYKYVNGVGTITLARPAVSPYPTLQTARYFFAVANRSGGAATYRLTFTMSPAPSPAVIQFGAPSFVAAESAGIARVTVTRTGNTSTPVSVTYFTNGGTASSRADYTQARGTLAFAAGETSKSFDVLIADDTLVEGSETVGLGLSSPGGGAALGAASTATLTITDNDTVNGLANPLDTAQFFVRQHYSDFLNRAPDASGLQFWTNEIAACGANIQCVDVKRINVSGAFFLSIEYQETSFFAYRLYKASFNRMPRMEELQPDAQTIGTGVVVGATNWQQLLESNKQAFINAWVVRDSFRAVYDRMSNVEYVDTLIADTGVPFSPSTRAALIIGLGTGAETRATVLRKIADDQLFVKAQTNPAFVLTQYFGYLRRNPNDPPDADFSGFNFWLTKLNQFNGNYIQAEMVKAFLASTEYRQRFGR
jgi:Zn-dependent metalloprotease